MAENVWVNPILNPNRIAQDEEAWHATLIFCCILISHAPSVDVLSCNPIRVRVRVRLSCNPELDPFRGSLSSIPRFLARSGDIRVSKSNPNPNPK